jgi:hypothetical protein
MKKERIILISVIILLVLVSLIFKFNSLPENYPKNLSETLSPQQAYFLIQNSEIPTFPIKVKGNLTMKGESLQTLAFYNERKEDFYITEIFLNISDQEAYDFLVENKLLNGGIIEVEFEGILTEGECCHTMNSHTKIGVFNLKPEDITFIRTIKCKDLDSNDCFDITYIDKILKEDAISKLEKSEICSLNSRDIKLDTAKYSYIDGHWSFSIFPGLDIQGCSEKCTVSSKTIQYIRSCSPGYNYPEYYDVVLLEEEGINSTKQYYDCLKNKNIIVLPFASNEPVGAERKSDNGDIWIKQEDGMWATDAEQIVEIISCLQEKSEEDTYTDEEGNFWTKKSSEKHKVYQGEGGYKLVTTTCWTRNESEKTSLHWGNILIDEQPGGIKSSEVLECNKFYDFLSRD